MTGLAHSSGQEAASIPGELEGTGWHFLTNAPKWHYFMQDGRSLCGRWMTFGRVFEQGNDGSPDNCAACRKKLERFKARTASSVGIPASCRDEPNTPSPTPNADGET
jgi:hypothetical protein